MREAKKGKKGSQRALADVLYRSDAQRAKVQRKGEGEAQSTYLTAPGRLAPSHAYAGTAFVFLAACLLYFLTAAPEVAGGDSGELAVAAHQWSTAHPPGYPLFTLLGHAFDKGLAALGFAASSPSWRIAMLSVLCDAAAAALLCLAVACWTEQTWAGVMSGGLFAFSRQVWLYATQPEVFPLNNLCLAAVLLLVVLLARKYHVDGDGALALPLVYQRPLFQAQLLCLALVGGLSFANQHTAVLFVLPLLLWAVASSAAASWLSGSRTAPVAEMKRQVVRLAAAMALVGFLAMASLYLLMAARQAATAGAVAFAWGDLRSWRGFLTHFLRREYGTLSLYSGGDGAGPSLAAKLAAYFASLQRDTLYLGAPLAAVGALAMVARGWAPPLTARACAAELARRAGSALLAVLALYLLGFFYLCNLPIHKPLFLGVFARFFPQANLLVLFLAGVGAAYLKFKLAPHYHGKFFFVAAVLLVAGQAQLNYADMDQSSNAYVRAYAEQVLQPLPRDSLLLVKGDLLTNPVMYLQLCEGYRPDVRVLSLEQMTYPWFQATQAAVYPDVKFPGSHYHPYTKGAYSIHDFLQANYHRFAIFNAGGWKPGDHTLAYHFETIPYGLTVKVVAKEEDWGLERAEALMLEGLPGRIPLAPLDKYGEDSWERVTVSDYWHAHHMRAHYKLNYILDHGESLAQTVVRDTAAQIVNEYETILEESPLAHDYLYLNLAIAYDSLRKFYSQEVGKEMAARMLDNFREFLAIAPPSHPNYRQVKNNVKAWDEFLEAELRHEEVRARSYQGPN